MSGLREPLRGNEFKTTERGDEFFEFNPNAQRVSFDSVAVEPIVARKSPLNRRGATTAAVPVVPFWGDAPELYDVPTIAGERLPGVTRVTGKGYSQRIDRRTVKGCIGERITQLGKKPAEIDFTVTLWTRDQLNQLARIVSLVVPSNKVNPPAVSVYHPLLALYRISTLTFIEVSLPEQLEEKDWYRVKLTAVEWLPPVKVKVQKQDHAIVKLEPNGGAVVEELDAQRKKAASPAATQTGP